MAALFGRFSKNTETVLIEAQQIAERLNRPIQSDVILLAVLAQNGAPAAELLKHLGASYTALFEHLPDIPNRSRGEAPLPGQDREMQLLLEETIKTASKYRFSLVEIEHILYTIARDDRFVGNMVLRNAGLNPDHIVARLGEWMRSVAALSQQARENARNGKSGSPANNQEESDESELEKFTIDLTERALNNELDPVIGRESELEQMIRVLLRRHKNNPLLVGEPGVGKTALVDALAQRIAARNVPKALLKKRVLVLDLGSVVAGTMYRGQFEERLKNIITEVTESKDTILFIDEIHTLTGAGGGEGSFDAANILKPALARGELSLIGATTYEEYRKHIMKDKALDRRFQSVTIEEPSTKDALAMLKSTKKSLEAHHELVITDAALRSAVELSVRYIHDRFLPDKAIDALDEAATLHAQPQHADEESIAALQEELDFLRETKRELVEDAIDDLDWEAAKQLAEKETGLVRMIAEQQKLLSKRHATKRKQTLVTEIDIARVISGRTGIPIEQITQTLQPMDVARITKALNKHILGQDAAIETIGQALMRAQLGLHTPGKPIGSFLLVGPTGVGKTETARILAREVFGDEKALIKIDMSEYMERHSASNLVGAPAGYVGFEQGGTLTEQVYRRPYAVVLFDEVEKAHPDVFNLLLQLLEDGVLTDNTGRQTSFEHALIIMTSNIGMSSFNQSARIGFNTAAAISSDDQAKQTELQVHITDKIKDFFRPELLGRLSATIFYQPLSDRVVKKLVEKRFDRLVKSMQKKGVRLSYESKVLDWAVSRYESEAGARSIERIFMHEIEPPVIRALLHHQGTKLLQLHYSDDALHVDAVAAPDPIESSTPL
jgi:ATP-dependent Clp protease ATP-binding subunit ClpC